MMQRQTPRLSAPKLPPLTDSTCAKLTLSSKPRILGWSATTRQLIEKRLHRGVLGVRYVKKGCTVQLIPQPACKIDMKYEYKRVLGKKELLVSSSGALWQELPLLAKTYAKSVVSGRAIKLFAETSGVMRIPASEGVHRDMLKNRQCKNVTHVVQLAALGRLAVVEGSKAAVEDYSGRTMPKAPLSMLEFSGDSKACRDQRLIRPAMCRSPIRFVLMPVKLRPALGGSRSVLIEAGLFASGPNQTSIYLDAFQLDKNEVSASQYDDCVRNKKCSPAGRGTACTSGVLGKEDHPINCVVWSQARAYCRWRDQRLPTEAQWGDQWPPPARIANLADESAKQEFPYWRVLENHRDRQVTTAPVTAFGPANNSYGLWQMAGNVGVWTEDWYRERLSSKPHRNPKGPRRGRARVVRGSSFGGSSQEKLTTYFRDFYTPNTRSMHIGIRCAR
jgi:hypothetical protein